MIDERLKKENASLRKTVKQLAKSEAKQKHLSEILKKKNEEYRKLVESANSIILRLDTAGNIVFINKYARRYFGFTQKEIVGRNAVGTIAPRMESSGRDLGHVIQSLCQSPKRHRIHMNENIKKDGSRVWILWTNRAVLDERGRVVETICIGSDITQKREAEKNLLEARAQLEKQVRQRTVALKTANEALQHDIAERKRTQEALLESEKKYKLLADKIPDIVFILNLDLQTTYVSPSIQTLLGFTPEERMEQTVHQQLTPASLAVVFDTLSRELALEQKGQGDPDKTFELELEYYHRNGSTRWMETIISGLRDNQGVLTAIHGMNRDITDRKMTERNLQQTLESLRKAYGTTMKLLVSAVEARDPYTAGHQIRVADLARSIGTQMQLSREAVDGIRMAGSIHDIGKLAIPSEILTKPTQLTEIEYSIIKEHVQKGFEMLKDVESSWPLAQIVYQHHERMDGSGYPRGLKGKDILMEARILAVADVVEAMATHRPYRPSLGIDPALKEIEKNRGILYDPDAADTCLKLFREKGYRFVKIS